MISSADSRSLVQVAFFIRNAKTGRTPFDVGRYLGMAEMAAAQIDDHEERDRQIALVEAELARARG